MLQEVAVVTGYLGDEAVWSQTELGDHVQCVTLRVRYPRVRVRREVRIVRKDVLARHIGGQLHEQARTAQPHVKRVKGFGFVEPFFRDVTLAKRRHPEVNKRVSKVCAAQAACTKRWHKVPKLPTIQVR